MAIHPVQVKYSFLRQYVFWGLFLPVLIVILMPLFINELPDVEKENETFASSNVKKELVNKNANMVFEDLFIKSGVYKFSERLFVAKAPKNYKSPRKTPSSRWFYLFWWTIYHGIWRCVLWIKALGVLFIGLLISICVDALVVRQKRVSEKVHSVSLFYLSSHALMAALGFMHTMLFLPITISATYVISVLLCVFLATWLRLFSFKS